jgi:hypothetical protein
MSRRPSEEAVDKIAEVMHEAVRAWQRANDQPPAPSWRRAPEWMRRESKAAVVRRIAEPGASASAQHEHWLDLKRDAGWKLGKVKSGVKKTHPLMVPYGDLPEVERRKDALVAAVIDALAGKMR